MENLFGEFMGMVVLVTFGCGVCANMALNKTCGHGGGWICITAGWALAVLLGVFTASAWAHRRRISILRLRWLRHWPVFILFPSF